MLIRISQIFVVLIFLGNPVCGFTTRSVSAHDSLVLVLDSVELQIQNARRNGEDMQVVIDQAESLKAAIDFQNENGNGDIQITSSDSVSQKSAQKNLRKKLTLPSSLIDWLIVLVGAIAALAAIMLVVLHGIKVYRRKRLMRRVMKQPVPPKRQKSTITQKGVQSQSDNADRKPESLAPEPVVPLATYTRQGTMKTVNDIVETKVEPVTIREPEPVVPSTMDVDFVQNMLAELIAKKQSVEKHVAEDDPIFTTHQETEIPVPDFTDELQSFDNLYDGLEDIMAEIDTELLAALDDTTSASEPEAMPTETIVPHEPARPRALTARETILELNEAGLSASEIARKLSMSVGEVQLIMSMARRS